MMLLLLESYISTTVYAHTKPIARALAYDVDSGDPSLHFRMVFAKVRFTKGIAYPPDLLRDEWESSMFGFVSAELDAARTFADMAAESYNAKNKMRHVKNARMAYGNAVRFAPRTPMSSIERKQIASELNSLRVDLSALGEVNIEREVDLWRENAHAITKTSIENLEFTTEYDLARRVRLFELACSHVRATATEMIGQNRSLMAGPRSGRRPYR